MRGKKIWKFLFFFSRLLLNLFWQESKNLSEDLGIIKSSTIPLTTREKQNREEEEDDDDDDDDDEDDVDAESHVMDTSFTSAGTMGGGQFIPSH